MNLGPTINQGNPGGRGVSGLGNPGRGRGLEVQEIWEEGGSKTLAIRRGCVDFFWNNPLRPGITKARTIIVVCDFAKIRAPNESSPIRIKPSWLGKR